MRKSGLWSRTLRIGMGVALAVLAAACGNRDLVAPGQTPVELVVMLSGGSSTQHSSSLIWSAPSTVDLSYGLRIYRDEKVVATLSKEQIGAGWAEVGLKPNTTYRYRVAVLRKDGTEQLTSNTIFVTTLPAELDIHITPESNLAYIGMPVQLVATVHDSATGAIEEGHTIVWSSSDGSVGTVSSTGLFTGFAPGLVTVTASIDGESAQKIMSVSAPPQANAASITVSPAVSSVDAGKTTQLNAIARDASGSVITRNFAWTTSNSSLATVSQSGLVTTIAAGVVTIRATADGVSGAGQISILPASNNDVASVTVTPGQTGLLTGGTSLLTATVRNAQGVVLTGRTITWTSENAGVVSVSPSGLVTGVSVGSTVIVASTGGASGSSVVTVSTPVAPAPEPVASITVTPGTATIADGGAAQFVATLRDGSGAVLTGRTVTWVSSNPTIATVAASGRVLGISAGTATITATSEGISGTATVTVQVNAPPPAAVASLSVTPATSTLSIGSVVQLVAATRDIGGTVLTGRVVTWVSSNPAAAIVSPTGLVTAIASGAATITATSEGQTATAQITVPTVATPFPVNVITVSPGVANSPIGSTTQFSAVLRDMVGNVLTGRTVVWTSSDPTIASVSASGVATAVKAGTVTITATSEGKTGTALLTVNPIAISVVIVTPAVVSLQIGETAPLTATVKSLLGVTLTGRVVTWTSSDNNVATVSSTGVVTAVSAGAVVVTATAEGIPGIAAVTVALKPVGSLIVTPSIVVATAGETVQLTATARDVDGTIVTGRVVTWTSSNASVALVSPTGLVTTVSGGIVTITASSEGKSDAALVTVAALIKPVATVTVSPTTLSLTTGSTGELVAVTKDADGLVLTGRPVVWTSSNPLVASVSSTGSVLALAAGSATITATSEGKSATAAVTVTSAIAPVASFTVTPSTLAISTGAFSQLTAVSKDSNGVVLTGRPVVWTSSNILVAVVSPTGVVTALLPGSATITATCEGKTATSDVTVSLAIKPVNSVTIAPSTLPLIVGAHGDLIATMKDDNGVVLAGRLVAWSSSNTAVATVNAFGNVTAVGAGTATITATSEGKSGTAVVTVSAVVMPVSTLTLSPGSVSVTVAATAQVTATAKDVNGTVLPGRVVVWTSSNPLVALVSQTGLVTGVTPGTATITATSEGVSASITATIAAKPVAAVAITSLTGFCAGTSLQLTATPRDIDGNIITGRAVVWTTSNASIATVSPTGLLVGLTVGSVTVTATVDGVSANATISLCAPVVATVQVTAPTNLLSLLGLPLQLIATPRDANGNVILGRAVTWSVTPPLKALLSVGGLLTPLGLGGVTVTATIDGVSASINITIGV